MAAATEVVACSTNLTLVESCLSSPDVPDGSVHYAVVVFLLVAATALFALNGASELGLFDEEQTHKVDPREGAERGGGEKKEDEPPAQNILLDFQDPELEKKFVAHSYKVHKHEILFSFATIIPAFPLIFVAFPVVSHLRT